MRHLKVALLLMSFLLSCESDKEIQKSFSPEPQGVVSTATPESTKAAVEILNRGGNAIDAAITASFVLGVTEPAMSGLGGGTQILLALPGRKPIAINGATISPSMTPINASEEDLVYHRRSTIPSTVKVLDYVFRKYGSGNLSWAELLEPAIQYAIQGFEIGQFRHKVYNSYKKNLLTSKFNTSFFLLPDGSLPAPGDTIRQPVLANTLKRLAKFGADDFYQGGIAKDMAEDMRLHGGWIQFEDLQNFPEPKELNPVTIKYRGFDVYSQPPPCGGWTALLMLSLLDEISVESLEPESKSRFDKLVEVLYQGHKERKEHPITSESDLRQRLDPSNVRKLTLNMKPAPLNHSDNEGGETTHFSIVDKDGMAVAVTASINAYFGAAAASPKLGFLYNTYMNDFVFGVTLDHPFSIGPGKMNYSSMSPTIVQKGGETELVIGSPGSARIISSVAQLIQLWADSDWSIEQIVSAKRLHVADRSVYLEDAQIPQSWLKGLRDKGYIIDFPKYNLTTGELNAYFGGVHAISKKTGRWEGASDPRRDGLTLKSDGKK